MAQFEIGINGHCEVPDGTRAIENRAFYWCTDLLSIRIPATLESIGMAAFRGCHNLRFITVSDENERYRSEGNCLLSKDGKTLILGCRTSVIPRGVEKIADDAFWGCCYMTSLDIPEGVTSIGECAFGNCLRLQRVGIPDSVTNIGMGAFWGCSSLHSIRIPEGVTHIEEKTFEACSSLSMIEIPDSVTTIGEFAFRGCSSLLLAKLPKNLKSVAENAFRNCDSLCILTL